MAGELDPRLQRGVNILGSRIDDAVAHGVALALPFPLLAFVDVAATPAEGAASPLVAEAALLPVFSAPSLPAFAGFLASHACISVNGIDEVETSALRKPTRKDTGSEVKTAGTAK